jgi:chorismate mutase
MSGTDHASHLEALSKKLVAAAEKRAALKAQVAASKKARAAAKGSDQQKRIKREVEQLSRQIGDLIREIAQPPPRRRERWTGVIPVTLRVESKGRKYEHMASTLDISDRGLRILTTTALTPGQTLEVFSSRSLLGNCRVVWVSGAGSDRPSEVGLEILR